MAKKSKYKTLEPQVREREGQYGVQRLERIFDEVPNIYRQYDDEALLSALRGDNAQTLMIMRPGDFENFASPLNVSGSDMSKGNKSLNEYVRELGVIARDKGFEDVPFLELGKPKGSAYLNIPGHEGRHRMRALEELGDESTLVRTLPRGSVREALPRRSRQEYLEALSREHGNPLLVNPEDITSDIIDLRRALPEQFAEGGEVAPEVLGGGTGIPYAKGGAIDKNLKDWYAASGGAASYTQSQQAQAKRSSDIQSFKEGKIGADELVQYYPGMNAAMVEAQLNPEGMKAGGEVRMQSGGEIDAMLEALSGDRESRTDPRAEAAGVIGKSLAKGMVSPFVGLYGTLSSGKFGSQEGIRAGEEAVERFMAPGDISAEAMPYVQDVGKFLEEIETKYKIPPIMPELAQLAGVRGVKPQVQSMMSGALDKVKELPPLPVGLSMEAVGPSIEQVITPKEVKAKPETVKAPANEVGLYSTAEKAILNMQRKQGSGDAFLSELKKAGVTNDELKYTGLSDFLKDKKALTRDEVQKHIQDNRLEMREIEYKQGDLGEDDFNFGDGRVVENDSYISDRADEYVAGFDDYFPRTREIIRDEIMEGYSKEDLEDPNILSRIDEEVEDQIKERAYEQAEAEYYENPEYEYRNSAGYEIYGNTDLGYYARDPDGRPVGRGDYMNFESAEGAVREDAMLQGLLGEGETRFADYQLDNGQNYRELLLVAPIKPPEQLSLADSTLMNSLRGLENKSPEQLAKYKELRAKHRMANQPTEFTDSHWSEPDVLLHMRVQDRTTTDGKPMLYVDEMQSDWHQKGNEDGYMTEDQMAKAADLEDVMIEKRRIYEEKSYAYDYYNDQLETQITKQREESGEISLSPEERLEIKKQDPQWVQLYREMTSAFNDIDAARRAMKGVDAGILDAPYKDNWHELGVKRILAYAAKNGYSRVGFSASPAQIKRWGTQEIAWQKMEGADEWKVAATEQRGGMAGRINLEAEARARGLLNEVHNEKVSSEEELRRIVDAVSRGLSEKQKDRIAKKTWAKMQKEDVGMVAPREEGQRVFYDNKLKKYAEKYAKKMGGEFYEAETKTGRGVLTTGGYGDVTEPVYVIELTPKLKDSAVKGQPYKKGGLVTQPKGWKLKRSRPCKDFKEQKFARGGAVKMQTGGDPRGEIRRQMAAGVPVFMSPGPEGVIARQMTEEENRAREEEAQAKSKRVSELPFADKLRGGYETARTIQSIVGQELAKPFVGLFGGEQKIKELEEGTPLPESEAGIEYLTNVGETLAPVAKAIETSKIPDIPFLPELGPVTYIPGVGRQVSGAVARAGKKIDSAFPESLRNLPVGGSTVPPAGAPSAAEAISGKVKVPADELGFYSATEKAAVNLQRKSGSGQSFLNDITKQPGVKKDELEATGLTEWLKSKPAVTKDEVVDYINNNKIQVNEVIKAKNLSDAEKAKMEELERLISKGWYDIPEEDINWYETTKKRYLENPEPRFNEPDLKLAGGNNYRELLLTLPVSKGEFKSSHWDEPNVLAHIRMQDKNIDGKKTLVIEEVQSDWHQAGRDKGYGATKPMPKRDADDLIALHETEMTADQIQWLKNFSNRWSETDESNLDSINALTKEYDDWIANQKLIGVPDAPFKEDWYQVALKRAVKYAADNDYDSVAIVGGKEQASRYALTKKVDAIGVDKTDGKRTVSIQTKGGGTIALGVDDDGMVTTSTQRHFERAVGKPITDVVGKAVGKKIMEMDKGVISGQGLDIGGEGMKKYYDDVYPKFLEKQYKKYGVKPERKGVAVQRYGYSDVESEPTGEVDRFGDEVMWYEVRDPNTNERLGGGYSWDKALKEANKGETGIWVMDLPANLKSDVKIGQSYKKGGLVKDEKLKAWHEERMAKGGIAKVAKAAEKASKRMSKAEAQAAGYWHDISETKLAKPIVEYKSKVVDDPSVQLLPRQIITPEDIQGGIAIPFAGDRAAAGRIIQEIEGVPMNVILEGGPDFMRLHPGSAWASGQGVLSMLAKRIKMARESGQPIYGVYTAMSPLSVDFNTMMTESLLNQMDISAFSKKDIEAFNAAVKSIKGQGGKPKAPNFPGLEDPELRDKLITGPGGQRDAFVKAMAKAGFQKRGFPDVAATRLAVTDPELLDVERGASGYTIARLDPEATIFEKSGHSTYPLDLAGDYFGSFENQLPVEQMYPTHFEAKRLMGKTPEGAHKSLELFAPLQDLDQSWLDSAMKYREMQKKLTGRKKGGLAHAMN
jgi:hypothetical protein